jgi:uncharacterized protein (TIGR02145 family)
MKQIFFLFAMLASVTASAQVTHVEPAGANYANKTVSFRVWWNAGSRNATHLSKVWVWVDYITMNSNNTTSGNTWTRATVGTVSGGVTSFDGSNRKGFWLEGNASTNYSATLTVQLTNVPDNFNWCAYVSDYPPNVTLDKGTYTFKGTTNFIVSSQAQPVTTKTIAKASLSVTSASTFTDATGCPGIGSLYCPYTGSDLYMDATHLCRQRTSGAQNWEAWIKDTRDNELYRIVYMPDSKWWLAQNVKLASYGGNNAGTAYSNCNKDECGRGYTRSETIAAWGGTSGIGENKQGVCPSGWILPSYVQYQTLFNAIDNSISWSAYSTSADCGGYCFTNAAVVVRMRNSSWPTLCAAGNDYYGWSHLKDPASCSAANLGSCYFYHTAQENTSLWTIARFYYRDCYANSDCSMFCVTSIPAAGYTNARVMVRCIRTL